MKRLLIKEYEQVLIHIVQIHIDIYQTCGCPPDPIGVICSRRGDPAEEGAVLAIRVVANQVAVAVVI